MSLRVSRATGIVAAVAVLAAGAAVTVAVWPSHDDNPRDGGAAEIAPTVPASAPADTEAGQSANDGPVAEPTLVASFADDVAGFDGPDGTEVSDVAATWHGRPSILPVIDQEPGWVEVRLPQRPNGSTAWVRRDDVELASTPYRVEIDVATTRLRVFKDGAPILDAPAGLGTDDAPTTVGNFFVAFLQEPPDTTSGWGPFVVVTSSHSETISDFQSSGDAIAAIHGPLGAGETIGETGAYVSHGCIRLHLDDLEVLRQLPAGTPIDVVDSGAGAAVVGSTIQGTAE